MVKPAGAERAGVVTDQRTLCNQGSIFGEFCPHRSVTRTVPLAYVLHMLSTLLVIGGVLVGLFVLLALIVSLSARPQATSRGARPGSTTPASGRAWTADAGRPHPDAWSPVSNTTTNEIPAVR